MRRLRERLRDINGKVLGSVFTWACSLAAGAFAIFPEKLFEQFEWFSKQWAWANIALNRVLAWLIIFVVVFIVSFIRLSFRKSVVFKGIDYKVCVEYGDLFDEAVYGNCKKVIAFDECFTVDVGDEPWQVKPGSICGKFLHSHPIDAEAMRQLIKNARLSSEPDGSKFRGKKRYASGKLVRYDDKFFLMSFAHLNENGSGVMSYDDYLSCLSVLWAELDKYRDGRDVCIPVIGSGDTTRLGDSSLTYQKLVDVILASYRLSGHKLGPDSCLRIVCLKDKDFSLNRVCDSL